MALAKLRKVGGSLVVTVPKELVEEERLKPGETVNVDIRRAKKSFYGVSRGVGPFTPEDEMKGHD